LVLTGDIMDGKPQVRGVMDLLMQLEKKARKARGRVLTLLGNHEVMNILGDHRYTTQEIYASFADKRSAKRRLDAYRSYLEIRRQQSQDLGRPVPEETPERTNEWMQAHPLGFVEYRKALAPKGKYGRWLRTLPTAVKIDKTIFLHGGIHPNMAERELREINEQVKLEVDTFDVLRKLLIQEQQLADSFTFQEMRAVAKDRLELLTSEGGGVSEEERKQRGPTIGTKEVLQKQLAEKRRKLETELLQWFLARGGWVSLQPDGPLWFRGYARWAEEEGTQKTEELLMRYGARHFVVGHTTTPGGDILRRFGGRVFLIDTARPSALQIQGNRFTAIYPDGRRILAE
jgi:hypothetical protein